ncbi:hypothetical protein JMJ77_0008221 [Colletotrichum scovillei]|uniref:Uncharacterized protein n=1 Tax=Colletotrichum scovillei TaxID=1209932 RepID=A0A9P7RDZ4_9PEZI|nr:hypothetical protein JMJ77_0008221 [Colletotrichum scovillei]KAG7075213.1 hypothetical protein JMJ76_0011674 [Colletotrichum scovillei]KAG7082214.1 hypothetical protein JMJ78_0004317 [Colletotrichum scovillei]
MSDADEDVHAHSNVATKSIAATTLPRLDKAATLPFELVLNIMDHAIHYAESIDFWELSWEMERDDSQALGVSLVFIETNLNPVGAPQRRFNGLRTLLHTNRKIRSMVLGKFCFLCPQAQEEKDVSNYVLINPRKDQFQVADHHAWDAVGHPRAALKPLVERMSKIFIGDGSFFAPSNSDYIEILQSLPSLCRVDIDVGRMERLVPDSDPPLVELEIGSGNWEIHAELFPDLAKWAENDKSTFPTIWQPFKERGVALLGWRIDWQWIGEFWMVSKQVWLNTFSDAICMNLGEDPDFYYWDFWDHWDSSQSEEGWNPAII